MERDQRKRSSIFIFCSVLASLLTFAVGEDLDFLSCLTSNGVHNFTTPSSPASKFNHFFHLSMQNPAFAGPTFLKPTSIVLPENKHQLASTITCAQKSSLTIRIRSGGHSSEGSSSIADTPFIIIDLLNLNQVLVDLESQTAWVEAGARLGEVYYAVGNSTDSFAIAGGWSPTVGTGGHISGGGSGILTRKYGLAADNVVDAILVDSRGRLLDREAMGEDVFWAIRGGGGGVFGAIYAWKIQLVPVPKTVTVISFFRILPAADAAKLLHRFQYVASELVEDFSIMTINGAKPDGDFWAVFYGLYLGPKSSAIEVGSPIFSELGVPEEECKEMSWVEAVTYLLGFQEIAQLKERTPEHGMAFRMKSDFVKTAMPLEGFTGLLERLQKEPHALITLLGQGGAMARIRSDATPFPHREGNLFNIEYVVGWTMEDDSQSDLFVKFLRDLYEYMTPFASKNPRIAYMNHIDYDLGTIDWSKAGDGVHETARSWGEKYFLKNYDRLVRAKTIIDPDNVFQHPQSIPPLPSSMCDGTISGGRDSNIAAGFL